MKDFTKVFFIVLILFFILFVADGVEAAVRDWNYYESEHFVVFYPEGYERQAEETLYYLEKHRAEVMELTGNEGDFQTKVVIEDIGMQPNGYADPITNKIGIFTNQPESSSGLANYENWFRLVGVHELTHIGHLNNHSGQSSMNVFLFGNLFSPNLHSPLWLIEGIAVYGESQFSDYEGRLNDGYYDAVLASKAQAGELPSLAESTYMHDHYPLGHPYLYGATFFRYLADTYGEDKFADFFNVYGSYHWVPFMGNFFPRMGLDSAAKTVYGSSFAELFAEWQAYETEKHQQWEIVGEQLSDYQRSSLNSLVATEDRLYYFRRSSLNSYPFQHSQPLVQLIEYNPQTGEEQVLVEHGAQSNGSIEVVDAKLYYSVQGISEDYANVGQLGKGVTNILYTYDLSTGEQERLLTADFKDFTVLAAGEVVYAQDSAATLGSELWSYSEAEGKQKLGETEQLISELREYQGDLIVVSQDRSTTWSINLLHWVDLELEPLVDTLWAETSIMVAEDQLYFEANYEGHYALYQYDLLSEDLFKLSQGDYARQGVPYGDDIYFVSIDSQGENLYKKDKVKTPYSVTELEEQKIQRNEEVPELTDLDLTAEQESGKIKNLSYLFKPHTRFFPNLLAGSDALGSNSYTVNYSQYEGFDFHFTSRVFSPLAVSVSNIKKEEGRQTNLAAAYPLYQSVSEGFASAWLDYSTNFDDSVPGLNLNFTYPRHDLDLYFQYNIANDGYNSEFNYKYLREESSLIFKGSYFENFDKDKQLRGFAPSTIEEAQGHTLSVDYIHKLFELRKGAWNPNFFIADVYGSLFVDYADFDSESVAYGYELLFEAGAGNWLYLVPKLGVSYSEGEARPYLGVKMEF
ncbi:hypothetical protein [Fuchsiella alkaliacetigena]|uniref:hypothetical protein n=1 Tax=Fuchsiella alkaliacetigena TaxID=957042 RepID=UPI00200A24D8|nr:hypothetical protein [Fuchsiella alkaliacetigena]MCK8823721.1 hypothetical protein [Fuchsiella alkaliacetigena]